jgi:hypothetical protein
MLWALLAWAVLLPETDSQWQKQVQENKKARSIITKILVLDPDRINYEQQKDKVVEFDYSTSVEQFAEKCRIAPSNYDLNARLIVKRGDKKIKTGDLVIKSVDIETFAKFLSSMLIRWPDLQCNQLNFTKLKNAKDLWQVRIKFIYNY